MSQVHLVSDQSFCTFINSRVRELMVLAVYIDKHSSKGICFTRPILGDLLSEATKIEELLDAYGVKHNKKWYPLRQLIAPIKLFSNVGYILLHILQFLPVYHLLPIGYDFSAATESALAYVCSILTGKVKELILKAKELDIVIPKKVPVVSKFSDELPEGQLPYDRFDRNMASPEETVVYLATTFLNLAEKSKFLQGISDKKIDNFAEWIPDPISEERLRNLELVFHNLQSLYANVHSG